MVSSTSETEKPRRTTYPRAWPDIHMGFFMWFRSNTLDQIADKSPPISVTMFVTPDLRIPDDPDFILGQAAQAIDALVDFMFPGGGVGVGIGTRSHALAGRRRKSRMSPFPCSRNGSRKLSLVWGPRTFSESRRHPLPPVHRELSVSAVKRATYSSKLKRRFRFWRLISFNTPNPTNRCTSWLAAGNSVFVKV